METTMKYPAFLLSLLLTPTIGTASDDKSVSSLTPELQRLFSKEMIQLKNGMHQITDAYISGQWDAIATTAKQMENTYVLRQGLSHSQAHELHSKLPKNFLKLDEQFHYYSGMLAYAAENNNVELIGFYISKMSESCVSCHSRFANEKFPDFRQSIDNPKHH